MGLVYVQHVLWNVTYVTGRALAPVRLCGKYARHPDPGQNFFVLNVISPGDTQQSSDAAQVESIELVLSTK